MNFYKVTIVIPERIAVVGIEREQSYVVQAHSAADALTMFGANSKSNYDFMGETRFFSVACLSAEDGASAMKIQEAERKLRVIE